MRASSPICMLVAGLLCGCTELTVMKAAPGEVEGIPYTLPKKTFIITVLYELKDCKVVDGVPQVNVGKTVAVTPTIEPDENERFYIPYSSLRNWFKDTSVTVESFDNQTLKAVTVTVTDKTGETITAAINSIIRVASIGTGVNMAGLATESRDKPAPPKCNPDADALLRQIAALKAKATLTADDTAQIADLKSQLIHKETVYWSPRKPQETTASLVLQTSVYPDDLVGPAGKWVVGSKPAAPMRKLTTHFRLSVNGTVAADLAVPHSGFVVRQGPSAILQVCDDECPTPIVDKVNGITTADETKVINTSVHVMPQLGSYVSMPLKNRIFENQTLTLTVTAEGAITKQGLTSNATALAGLQSLNTDLDAIIKAKEARDKAAAAAATSAQNAKKDHADQVNKENTAIADCLKAQKALIDAGGTVTGTCQ